MSEAPWPPPGQPQPPPGQPQQWRPPPQPFSRAVFSGALGDKATGGWYPARAVLENGMVTLWVASANEWRPHFTVPANHVMVKSAAQRITLVVQGRPYPILADPGAVNRGMRYTRLGTLGRAMDAPALAVAGDMGRIANQAGAANAFSTNGGSAFLAAMRQSGAHVSRMGFGALFAIGACVGLLVAFLTLFVLVLLLVP